MSFLNTSFSTLDSRYAKVFSAKKYGADPTGNVDSGPAIRLAFSDLSYVGGGTLYFEPGTYKVISSSTYVFLTVPANIRLLGDSSNQVIFKLYADIGQTYMEFARNAGNNVSFENITIQRATDTGAVMFNTGTYSGFKLTRVIIDGQLGTFSTYCHGMQISNSAGTATDYRFDQINVKNVTFSILTTNSSMATVDGFTIVNSRFSGCGISFNAPNGSHSNILIQNNIIEGTNAPANTFGIDLAHVSNVTIRDNTISNFASEGLHIEDYSTNISVSNNRFITCATGTSNSYGFIEIISGTSSVTIDGNTFDARSNGGLGPANGVISLLAGGSGNTPGGRAAASPSLVSITNNAIFGGSIANGIYIDACPSSIIAHNKIIGAGNVASGSYSGPNKSALRLAGLTGGQVNNNILRGWNAGVEDVNQTLNATLFTQNLLRDCNITVTARAFTGAYTAGTIIYNCVSTTTLN